ncbi:hypothetical protein J9253_04430 [Thiothrix litoralis]|uniref:Uncharacterized protein n=1 Tax=Thiothrix litoralis TaxID=2891210 RepID=A0ABX7WVZ2_9GAMM|nr:hypothetical protein [Thiothrix litoralis]QTR47192.1 hypothetical protein J9253_04430 [Thiothrix litoralis]
MTNNEYQTMAMSHHMLREFQEQCKQQEAAAIAAEVENTLDYQQFEDEVLAYPIFSNHACRNHDAKELLAAGSEEAYCERWRFFYAPDPWKLPQIEYQQQMEAHLDKLRQRMLNLTSPRLILFAVAFVAIILLVMRGHFLLPALPIAALSWYWYRSELKITETQRDLHEHLDKLHALEKQQQGMAHQLDSLPPPAGLEQLHQQYQQAVEHLFRGTLLHLLNPPELGDLSQTLPQQHWEGFITESWGHLQLPLPNQKHTDLTRKLLDEAHIPLIAMLDDPYGRKGHSLYRLQYLHVWILTQNGLLMGRGYFDRVANQFLYEQHEFYPYTQLSHLELTEQPLPELAILKQRLPENLYQRYFQQPVSVLSVGTSSGKTYECAALPISERPFRQTLWKERYGLDTDMQRLNRCLHRRLYPVARTA